MSRFLNARPFEDKCFIVTGAAGGIGIPTLQMLAQGGATLIVNDIDAQRLESAVKNINPEQICAQHVGTVNTPEEAAQLVSLASKPLYGLVHLAGIFQPTELDDGARDNYDRTMAANATNAFDLCVKAIEHMEDGGTILFISSLAFMRGSPDHVPYSMAKGALVGLTRSLSRRLAHRQIRVNALTPGVIKTDMPKHLIAKRGDAYLQQVPMGRFGEAEEVADAIGFFCSPASQYITGQLLSIDGGIVNG